MEKLSSGGSDLDKLDTCVETHIPVQMIESSTHRKNDAEAQGTHIQEYAGPSV